MQLLCGLGRVETQFNVAASFFRPLSSTCRQRSSSRSCRRHRTNCSRIHKQTSNNSIYPPIEPVCRKLYQNRRVRNCTTEAPAREGNLRHRKRWGKSQMSRARTIPRTPCFSLVWLAIGKAEKSETAPQCGNQHLTRASANASDWLAWLWMWRMGGLWLVWCVSNMGRFIDFWGVAVVISVSARLA